MGLNARWLVSLALLALPIAVTLGVLLGLDAQRKAEGKPPIFIPDRPKGGNWVENRTVCNRDGIIDSASTEDATQFRLNPNAWGLRDKADGQLCMSAVIRGDGKYGSLTSAPPFNATWYFPKPQDPPVHAFANSKVEGTVFPDQLSTMNQLVVDLEWDYYMTDQNQTRFAGLEAQNVNANVAIDMFMDTDKSRSTNEYADKKQPAKAEVMVWLGAIGPSTQPVGTKKVGITGVAGGRTFELFSGQNENGQYVLTWRILQADLKFHGDIFPLIQKLMDINEPGFPKKEDYIGYLAIGTEAFTAPVPVTFSVTSMAVDVKLK